MQALVIYDGAGLLPVSANFDSPTGGAKHEQANAIVEIKTARHKN